jgi:hypothetical protein
MPDAETTTTTPKKKAVHWQEVQDTVSRLAAHKGVLAISILNSDGDIVTQQLTSAGASRQTVGNNAAGDNIAPAVVLGNPKLLAGMMKAAGKYVESLSGHEETPAPAETEDDDEDTPKKSPKEDISFVRIRTQTDEILVAPKLGYTLVVLQDPTLSAL